MESLDEDKSTILLCQTRENNNDESNVVSGQDTKMCKRKERARTRRRERNKFRSYATENNSKQDAKTRRREMRKFRRYDRENKNESTTSSRGVPNTTDTNFEEDDSSCSSFSDGPDARDCNSDEDESSFSSFYESQISHSDDSIQEENEELSTAVPVENDALDVRYKVPSRESVLKRMKAELSVANEVVQNSSSSHWKFCLTVSVFVIISIVIVLTVVFSVRDDDRMIHRRSGAPTTAPIFVNFTYLQELMEPISGNSVYDYSSFQYNALEWLAFEDPYLLEIPTSLESEFLSRYILVVLYFSTGGLDWIDNLNFLTNSTVCDWHNIVTDEYSPHELPNGIICDNYGSVRKIILDQNGLRGIIPIEIAEMKSLEEISFSGNSLYGTIPTSFGDLFRLDFLQIDSNDLTGSIPNSFSYLTKLEYFSTRYNQLTGTIPSGVTKLKSLERIDLRDNLLTGIIPEFAIESSNIEYIALSHNLLIGTIHESLFLLSSLEVLLLSYNFLNGTFPSHLETLKRLSILMLFENDLSGPLPISIGNIDLLVTLTLNNNRFTGTIPSEIGKLTKLGTLIMSNNDLTGIIPSEIVHLTDLRYFFIENNSLSGTISSSIFYLMPNLEMVTIQNNNMTGSLASSSFCDIHILFSADCGGSIPKVNCTCCSECCDDTSGQCEQNIDLWSKMLEDISFYHGHKAECIGTGFYDEMSCYFQPCLSCNDDESICGNLEIAGLRDAANQLHKTYHNTFTYTIGRNETILWEEQPEIYCNVWINGQQCNQCTLHYCRDGFPARHINCQNVINGTTDAIYDTCKHYEKGGIFEYISWFDSFSWNGCLPFFYRSLQ